MKISNWEEWQSFRKDRGAPPWIKLHRNLLTNKKWAILSDAEKGQLVSLWIIAGDSNGEIPDDPSILRKICQLDQAPNISKFMELGLLTTTCQPNDNQMTTTCQPNDAPEQSRGEERRAEKSREEENQNPLSKLPRVSQIPLDPGQAVDFENFRAEYPIKTHRREAMVAYGAALDAGVKHSEIMNGVDRLKKSIERGDTAFPFNPGKWLDDHGWENDYKPKIPESTVTRRDGSRPAERLCPRTGLPLRGEQF